MAYCLNHKLWSACFAKIICTQHIRHTHTHTSTIFISDFGGWVALMDSSQFFVLNWLSVWIGQFENVLHTHLNTKWNKIPINVHTCWYATQNEWRNPIQYWNMREKPFFVFIHSFLSEVMTMVINDMLSLFFRKTIEFSNFILWNTEKPKNWDKTKPNRTEPEIDTFYIWMF